MAPQQNLRPNRQFVFLTRQVFIGLPSLSGSPVYVLTRPRVIAYRGRLVAEATPQRGADVHAASFVPQRIIVLEEALLSCPEMFRLILVHELFHFVWPRLGNGARAAFSQAIRNEVEAKARGELGESASVKKPRATPDWFVTRNASAPRRFAARTPATAPGRKANREASPT